MLVGGIELSSSSLMSMLILLIGLVRLWKKLMFDAKLLVVEFTLLMLLVSTFIGEFGGASRWLENVLSLFWLFG